MNMNTLKIIQISLIPTNPSFLCQSKLAKGKKSIISFCNSNSADPGGAPSSEGDKQKQELLAKIAQLQTQKVRLTDFLDERSAFLTQFAEDANTEFDEIAEDALKGLEEASDRIMADIESRMQAFEETAEANREEIEKNEKVLADFEDQIEEDRNEGLFFKNLGQKAPKQKVNATQEMKNLREVTRENAGSKIRRSIYLALICLLVFTIVDAVLTSPELDWRKVGALGAILVGLVAQLIYEQKMASETEEAKEEK